MRKTTDWIIEKEAFEDWYLNHLPDADETLLKQVNSKGEYTDETMVILFAGFCGGYVCGIISEIRR